MLLAREILFPALHITTKQETNRRDGKETAGKNVELLALNSQQLTQGQYLASVVPAVMEHAVICTRHFLQTHCNSYVKNTDTTVGGVLLLQDLTTEAFTQNDRLVPKEDFYKKK